MVGIDEKLLVDRRFWTSSGEVPSGGYGTKKWPVRPARDACGVTYDATASTGRWNGGDGTTRHSSPSGSVTRPRSRQNVRARSVHSSYASRIASDVAGWSAL